MHGGWHGGDNAGLITGNAALRTCDRIRRKYDMPPEKLLALGKSRVYAQGHHTPYTCTLPAPTLLVVEESPADATLVRCYQPNKSAHVTAAAVGEAAGSADLRPSAVTAAAAGRHHAAAPSPPIAAEAACSPQT